MEVVGLLYTISSSRRVSVPQRRLASPMPDWLKAFFEMLKAGKQLKEAIEGVLLHVFSKRTSIAITGMAGVGKTVLFDFLSGQGGVGYQPPPTSESKETGIIKTEDKRYRLTTVPG
jgi:hypothetical protein